MEKGKKKADRKFKKGESNLRIKYIDTANAERKRNREKEEE